MDDAVDGSNDPVDGSDRADRSDRADGSAGRSDEADETIEGANDAPEESDETVASAGDVVKVGDDGPTYEWPEGVPRWNDDYFDRVALRLTHHYDLERDYDVDGRRFPMYGQLHVRHERHVIHQSVTFAEHRAEEHVFVDAITTPTVTDLERLSGLGERLAEEWVEADEDHYSTDFSFVVVATTLADDVAEYVDSYSNRTLLKYGYYGHTEVNLVVVVPDEETSVGSETADVEQAFRVWEPIVKAEPGRISRLLNWLSR